MLRVAWYGAPSRGAAVLAAALAAAVVALPSLANRYAYDDVELVRDDARLERTPELLRLLAEPYWPDRFADRLYRPLTTLSFGALRLVGRNAPWVQHLANVLLHVLASALVALMTWRLAPAGAFVAGLWFAVHPVHVEAFASVAGRAELIAAVGYLGALLAALAHATAPPESRWRWLAAAAAAAAVAVCGKEHAVTLPLAIVILDAALAGGRLRSRAKIQLPVWVATAAVVAAFLAARALVLGTAMGAGVIAVGLEDRGIFGRLLVMTPALLEWARLLAFPVRLAADYAPDHFVVPTSLEWRHAAALALAAGLFILAWRARRRTVVPLLALLLFAVCAAVAANVVVPTGVLISERSLYLPSAAAAIGVAALAAEVPRSRGLTILAAVMMVLLAARSVARVGVWRDNETFFAALETDAPYSYRTQWMLGNRAWKAGRIGEARLRYAEAMRRGGRDAALQIEVGLRHLEARMDDSAEVFLSRAFALDSTMSPALLGVVIARSRLGRLNEAAAAAALGMRRFPQEADFSLAASELYAELGRCAEAEAALRMARRAAPARAQRAGERLRATRACGPSR